MSFSTMPAMTAVQLLALPNGGTERELIRGQLRERPMTRRNRSHGRIEARIAWLLGAWLEQQPEPRGEVLSGEAGCRLRRNPDTVVGIDVAYVSAELASRQPVDTTLIDDPPVLAVEILSPSDTVEEIDEKLDEYLAAGAAIVWVVDPHFCTVDVYRPDGPPVRFNVDQEPSAEPHLPGFRTPVARIFER